MAGYAFGFNPPYALRAAMIDAMCQLQTFHSFLGMRLPEIFYEMGNNRRVHQAHRPHAELKANVLFWRVYFGPRVRPLFSSAGFIIDVVKMIWCGNFAFFDSSTISHW